MLRDRCTDVCQIVLEQRSCGTPDGKAVENTVRIWGLEATFVTLSLGDFKTWKDVDEVGVAELKINELHESGRRWTMRHLRATLLPSSGSRSTGNNSRLRSITEEANHVICTVNSRELLSACVLSA